MRKEEETEYRTVCTKHSRSDPTRPCRQQAVWTLDCCISHGGGKPAAQANGVRRWAAGVVREMMETYGGPVKIDAVEALTQEIWRTQGHVLWLQDMVTRSLPDDLAAQFWEYKRSTSVPTGFKEHVENRANNAYAGVWLDLYIQERAHLVRACREAISLNLSERRLTLDEKLAQMLAVMVTNLARDFGQDPEAPHVREKIYMRLTEMGALVVPAAIEEG
jgi:hypothetical protein